MVLSLSGDKSIAINDAAKGSIIARTSFKTPITDALWSGDEQSILVMTCDKRKETEINHIYKCQWKSGKQETIADNARSEWDADSAKGRYVICRQTSDLRKKHTMLPGTVNNPASLIILDAVSLKTAFASGQNCGNPYTFSPDMNRVAYIELAKDEYGDYFRHDLKVADIRTGKVMNPAFSRRPLKYIWAGNKTIAYVEPDKYDLLSVRLFDIDSGTKKTFISNLSVPAIKLVAYDEQSGILYYKILDTYASSTDDPVCWAVSFGGKPVSSEQKSFPKPKSEAVRKLVMPGLYTKGSEMPGMPSGMPTAPPPPKGAAK